MGNKEEWAIEERIPCECYTHEMSVYSDEDNNECIEFAYWQRGKHEQPWTWKTRIKTIWDILTTGNPYSDMIILNQENALKLKNTIELFLEKNNRNV
jgi:hypothetical protein